MDIVTGLIVFLLHEAIIGKQWGPNDNIPQREEQGKQMTA